MIASSNPDILVIGNRYWNIYDDDGTVTSTVSGRIEDNRNTTHILIDEYMGYWNSSTFDDIFLPAHKVKNPFEYQIFESIRLKHHGRVVNKNRNVTFKRQEFKGFI